MSDQIEFDQSIMSDQMKFDESTGSGADLGFAEGRG